MKHILKNTRLIKKLFYFLLRKCQRNSNLIKVIKYSFILFLIDKLIRSSGGMEGDISQSTVTAWGINVGSKLASGVAKVCSNIFSGSTKPATSPGKISVIFMLFEVSVDC